jgi:Na+-transporting NADH:ubiquinone oxidoreductase subunit NqrB
VAYANIQREQWVWWDPRHYQILSLLALLAYGWLALSFDISPLQAAVTLAIVLAAQWLCASVCRIGFDPRSALISGLSLCLLLRTNSLAWVAVAAVLAVTTKFLIRWNGKHIFNPTNFALVALMLCSGGQVWVSPAQWGAVAWLAFLIACAGGWVVNRAARADVTLAFLVSYAALLVGRSMWLGEPMTIPLHRLQNGALLLFAFFMISDPKSTPDSRSGRIIFGVFVAFGAGIVQFKLFRNHGILWSLAACSLAVPLLDRWLPCRRFAWPVVARPLSTSATSSTKKDETYEPIPI